MKKSNYYQIFQFRGRELIDSGVLTAEGKIRVPFKSFCALLEKKAGSVFLPGDTVDGILSDDIKYDSTISIPYNAALRQILLLDRDAGKAVEENPLTGPKDKYYYLKTLLYIDMNDDNDSNKLNKEETELIINGVSLEIDENGGSLDFFLFERSASQQRQNVLVMVNERNIGTGQFDYCEGIKYYNILKFDGHELFQAGDLTEKGQSKISYKSLVSLLEKKSGSTLSEEETDILRSSIVHRSIIKIPYSEVLSKIYKAKEVKCHTDSPADPYYYQKSLLYIDINNKNSNKVKLNETAQTCIKNGLVLEIDKNGCCLEFSLTEQSDYQKKQGFLVMVNSDIAGELPPYEELPIFEGSPLYRRISCGLDNMKSVIASKFSAYRALMMTAGVCVDMDKTGISCDTVAVVPDFTVKDWIVMCKSYNKPVYSENEKNVHIVCDTVKEKKIKFSNGIKTNICNDALFDGEGLISSSLCETIAKMISEDKTDTRKKSNITSLQVRMPFVKGVLHSVNFKKIFCDLYGEENYDNLYLTDGFKRKLKLSDIRIILTFSMFKMNSMFRAIAEEENRRHNLVSPSDMLTGWDIYWKYFQKYKHSLFISGCNEMFSKMPDFTVSNYQFLSTLNQNSADVEELVLPSLNSAWTSAQSSSSMAQNYLLCSRMPYDDEEQDGDELAEGQLRDTENIDVKMLRKCSEIINTTMFRDRIRKSPFMKSLSTGHLIYPGVMKYLSGDLMQMICLLTTRIEIKTKDDVLPQNNIAGWMDEAADVLLPENGEFTELFHDESPDSLLELLFARECDVRNLSDKQRRARTLTELVRLRKSTDFKNGKLTAGREEINLVRIWEKAEPLKRLKELNRQAVLNGLYTPFFYAAKAPKKRGVVDRNPHLTRNEHVVIDPPVTSEIRDKYFGHLSGVVMIRCATDYFVQRLGGADFDGDIVRIFYSDSYIQAAMDSLSLNPLKIPSLKAGPEAYDDFIRGELIHRSSGSRVGKFSNDAFRTSLLAYSKINSTVSDFDISVSEQRTANETMVELSCVIGLEIDSAKTGIKPEYPNKRMQVYDKKYNILNTQYLYMIKQESNQDSKSVETVYQKKDTTPPDPARLSYFLAYKNIIKNNISVKCAFLPVVDNIRQYTLVELLPYIFNPKGLVTDEEVLNADNFAYLMCNKIWQKTAKKNIGGETDSISYVRRIDGLVGAVDGTRYLYELVEGGCDSYSLSIEEMDMYCALRAYFFQISKKSSDVKEGKRKTEVFRLLTGKYGEKTSRSLLERMDRKLGEVFKSEELILDTLLDILPWKNLYSGEQRRLRFEKLAGGYKTDSSGKNAALFEELCCQLNPNLRDDHLLAKIMLLNAAPQKNKNAEFCDITEHDKTYVNGVYDSDKQKKRKFILLCKAVYAENFVTSMQEMQKNLTMLNLDSDNFAQSFYRECSLLNIVLPTSGEEKKLLDELVRNYDRDKLKMIFAYLPEPYSQVRRLLEMRITGSRSGKITPKHIPELYRELKKAESLWQALGMLPCDDFQKLCDELYNEGDDGTFWLKQQDITKREEWFNKRFECEPAEDSEDVYADVRDLIAVLCEPSNWQLLPAYLNYARATVKNRERNRNRVQFNREGLFRLYDKVAGESDPGTDRNEDEIFEQAYLATKHYSPAKNPAKPVTETVEDTVKCLVAWQETKLDSGDVEIDTEDGFVVINGLRIRIGAALCYSYIMNKYANKRQKFSDMVSELFTVVDTKNTADVMLRKLLEFEKFSVTERKKRNPKKSKLDIESDSVVITDKADSIERFVFRAYPEELFNALKSRRTYTRVSDFEPDVNCGYLDGSQGVELAVSSEDSKLPDMQLSFEITTFIEDSAEKSTQTFVDMIGNSVKQKSKIPGVAVDIDVDHSREKSAIFDRRTVYLYSVPFEVCIKADGKKAVLKGAFSSIRLPLDSSGNVAKGYEDLAEPFSVTVDLKATDGVILLSLAGNAEQAQSVRKTKPIDYFICGYRKYKRTGIAAGGEDGIEK